MSGSVPTPGGTPPAVATDQSMEDILASIRRILNEDETPAAPAPAAPAAGADNGSEPLLLTEEMMVPAAQDAPVAEPAAPPEAPTAPPPVAAPAAPSAPVPSADSLLAPAVAAAAMASVGQLLRAVSAERGAAVTRGGPTIEDVVREELRPLLKDWLDQHLPAIVERLVRAEIERVTGRALS